jgi:hypothetical protein
MLRYFILNIGNYCELFLYSFLVFSFYEKSNVLFIPLEIEVN